VVRAQLNSHGGAVQLTQHLIGLGHRRIALLGGNPLDSVSQQRHAGYTGALEAAGLTVDPRLVREADWSTETSWDLTGRVLALPDPPTALFCTNNLLAVGALMALRSAAKRVPEDIELTSLIDPWLTVVVVSRSCSYELNSCSYELKMLRGTLMIR
jgi:DNA-binding LacI/PurR family transcriptional regulator